MMDSVKLLAQFIAQSPAAVAMFDRAMIYLAASERWSRVFEVDQNLVGRRHGEIFPDLDADYVEAGRRALKGETLRSEQSAFFLPSGQKLWLRWETRPWRRGDGSIGGIVVFVEDVTEMIIERERTRQSEAALRALGDNLPESVVYRYRRDGEGKGAFLYLSAGIGRLTGISAAEGESDAEALFSRVAPLHRAALDQAIARSQSEMTDLRVDVQVRGADEALRWIRVSARPERQGDDAVQWCGVMTDISDQIRRQQARRNSALRKSFLLDLGDAIKPLSEPAKILQAAAERLALQLDLNRAVFCEIDPRGEYSIAHGLWTDGGVPAGEASLRLDEVGDEVVALLRRGEKQVFADLAAEPRVELSGLTAYYRQMGCAAAVVAPMMLHGELIGVLAAQSLRPRPWSAFELELIEETCERASAALARARADQALRDSEQRLRMALEAADACAFEWSPDLSACPSRDPERFPAFDAQTCPCGESARLDAISPEDRAAAAAIACAAAARGEEFSIEYRVVSPESGERWMLSRGEPLTRSDSAPPRYIGLVFDITDRKRAEARMTRLAHHDALTDLPNRLAFNDRFAQMRDSVAPLSILCLDLDRFKEVNDVFGHMVGDELLREVARRFRAVAPDVEIFRVGGDEFFALLPGAVGREETEDLCMTLISALDMVFEIAGRQMRIGLSIGVARRPDHGDLETALANADAALYRAKAEGGGKFSLFSSAQDSRLREQRALLADLKHAIARHELILHYQPQADGEDRIFGFEALVRWRHPQRGLLPPDRFIPVAEERGQICDIGEWVLREACREAASWPRPLQISVNLSPAQFLKDGLPGLVHGVLLESGLPGHRLELEITENVLINDFSRVTSILRQLKALGVKVAMDDFGVGYSSLSYLQSFPFDKIKIDRSFVKRLLQDRNSQAIIRAMVALGKGLGAPLIAEGVETTAQRDFLREVGCDEIQGFLIGRPAPIEDYRQFWDGRAEPRPQWQAG